MANIHEALVNIVFIIYKILLSVNISYWKKGIYCTNKRDWHKINLTLMAGTYLNLHKYCLLLLV